MFTELVESRARRRSGWRGAAVSVLAHAALIGGAVRATVAGMEPPAPPSVVAIHIDQLVPPSDPAPKGGGTGGSGTTRSVRAEPRLPTPPEIPRYPTRGPDLPSLSMDSLVAGPGAFGDGESRAGDGHGGAPASGVYDPAGVDRLAEPLPGNPQPSYPAALRSAGVEGVVSARFVIDTTGRAERESIAFDGDPDALFVAAVRRALERSRFAPAEARGRRVRVLARQEFVFRIDR